MSDALPSDAAAPRAHEEKDLEKDAVATPDSSSDVSASAANNAQPDNRRPVHGFRWVLVCASIYIAAFTYGLDTSIAAAVQSSVVEAFGQVDSLSWLGTGFLLGSVATILPVGNILERFNQKWGFIGGLALFELGSTVCGAAPNMNALIVGRVIAGMGGSGVYMGGLDIFSMLTNERERGSYISAMGIFWGLGAVIGPVIGGAFADSSATWRWAFYINLVLAAVCAPIYLFCLPAVHPMSGVTIRTRLFSIDWFGALVYAAIWVLFTIIFTFAGSTWAWSDGRTIACFVVFGVLLLAFIAQQRYSLLTTPENRLFPVALLHSRTQVLLYFGMACASTALFTPIYYIPIYFQFVHGDTAIDAAVRLLPFLCVSMTANFAVGYLFPRFSWYAPLYLVAGIFIVAGAAPLYTINDSTPIANVYGYTVLLAFGVGPILQAGYTIAAVKLVKEGRSSEVNHSVALQNVAQIGSAGIALIISGQVFQEFAFRNLLSVFAGSNFSDEQIRSAVAGAQSAIFHEIDAATAAKATAAITAALANVWILVITAGALSVITSLLMKWERLF